MKIARNWVFIGVAVLVSLYAAAIFYHLRTSWDLGIRCLFSEESQGQSDAASDGPVIQWVDAVAAGPNTPERGDRLLRMGGVPVPTILHYQQRLAEIRPPNRLAPTTNVARTSDLAKLPADNSLAQIGEQRWVRLEFLRGGTTTATPQSDWLLLRPTPSAAMLASLAWFALETVILVIGAVVVWKRPGDPSAAIFFALCVVSVVAFIGGFHWPSLVGSPWLVYPFVFCALLLPPLTLHFYALFPRPLPVLRRRPTASLASIYALPTVGLALMFFYLLRIHWLFEEQAPVGELRLSLHRLGMLVDGYLAASGLMLLASFFVLRKKLLISRTVAEYNQVKWLLSAALLATGPLLYLLATALHDRAEFAFGPWPKLTVYVVSLIFTLAYAVSITRYKLLQVGEIVNRGILYVAISFGATALFCILVGLATALVGTYYFRWENAVMAGMTAMVVVVFLGWVARPFSKSARPPVLSREVSPRQGDPPLERSRRSAGRTFTTGAATDAIDPRHDRHGGRRGLSAQRGRAQFQVACRNAWNAAPERLAADCPAVQEFSARTIVTESRVLRELGAALGCVLETEGAAVGLILLGPKEDGTPYSPEDQNFLLALARTAALALRGAQGHRTINSLKEELQDKVQKIAEQQRRIMILQSELNRGASAEPIKARAGGGNELKHEIRGSSPAIRELLTHVAKIAQSSSSVMIRGESGTGKELLAQAIHFNSPRAPKPFVQVHCAALSPGLLESELFGHVKGAFTGADRDKIGRFELADGGTLFLDEIGDISLETQTKLLRVLQERAFERVGGVKTIQVDVRLIAATHQNLEELIRSGRFREDLFYRLNVISLRCPSLRERREDIFELALHFLRQYSQRAGKPIVRIEDEALEVLARTIGRATSGSWRTPSSGPWCWPKARRSADRTGRRKFWTECDAAAAPPGAGQPSKADHWQPA